MLTNQQIFDQCCAHVLKQGEPSINRGGGCEYLGESGLSCALGGPIVATGGYDKRIEGQVLSPRLFVTKDGSELGTAQSLLRVALTAWGVGARNIALLRQIQDCHDEVAKATSKYDGLSYVVDKKAFVRAFKRRASAVAGQFKLESSVLGVVT